MPHKKKMEIMLTIITMSLLFTGVLASECGRYKSYTDLRRGRNPSLDPSDWPWVVALYHQDEDNKTSLFCGATLVSRHTVVTAAHCISENLRENPQDIELVMGRTKVQNWRLQEWVQIRKGRNVSIHHSYLNSKAKGADVALIELDSPIQIVYRVSPVCVREESLNDPQTSNMGTVVGWGKDEETTHAETLRNTTSVIVDNQVCLQSHPKFENVLNNSTFCAGRRDGTGPCYGDSGSGMYVLRTRPKEPKSWVLRGVVSRTMKISETSNFCDLHNYIVFTDMFKIDISNMSCSLKYYNTFSSLDMIRIDEKYYFFEFGMNENNRIENSKVTYSPCIRVTRLIPPTYPQLLNWTSAQQFCRSHGMQLASVETKRENDLIVEHIKKWIDSSFASLSLWLGGSDSEREETWRWTSGQTLNFTNWGRGKPDKNENQNCMRIVVETGNGTHHWSDDSCSLKRRFICELEDVCP